MRKNARTYAGAVDCTLRLRDFMKYELLQEAHFEYCYHKTGDGRFESLTAVLMRIQTFWDVTL